MKSHFPCQALCRITGQSYEIQWVLCCTLTCREWYLSTSCFRLRISRLIRIPTVAKSGRARVWTQVCLAAQSTSFLLWGVLVQLDQIWKQGRERKCEKEVEKWCWIDDQVVKCLLAFRAWVQPYNLGNGLMVCACNPSSGTCWPGSLTFLVTSRLMSESVSNK